MRGVIGKAGLVAFLVAIATATPPTVRIASDAGESGARTTSSLVQFSVYLSETSPDFQCDGTLQLTNCDVQLVASSGCVSDSRKGVGAVEDKGSWVAMDKAETVLAVRVTCSVQDGVDVVASVPPGAFTNDAGEANQVGASITITPDQSGPFPMFSSSPSSPTNAATFVITALFNELALGVSASSFYLTTTTGAALQSATVSDTTAPSGGNATRVDVLVAGAAQQGVVSVGFTGSGIAAITDDLGNHADAAKFGSINVTIDRTAPTATISSARGPRTNSPTNTITIAFSESVVQCCALGQDVEWDAGTTDASVGTLLEISDSRWELVVGGTVTDGQYTVRFNSSRTTDAATNAVAPAQLVVEIDVTGPLPTLTAGRAVQRNTTNTITVEFDEDVVGLAVGDFAVVRDAGVQATLGALSVLGPRNATVEVVGVVGDGEYRVQLPQGAVADSLGNPSRPGTVTVVVDQTPPSVTLSSPDLANNTRTQLNELTFVAQVSENTTLVDAAHVLAPECDVLEVLVAGPTLISVTCEVLASRLEAADVVVEVRVSEGAVEDSAGNPNAPSLPFVVIVDRSVATVRVCATSTNAIVPSLAALGDRVVVALEALEPLATLPSVSLSLANATLAVAQASTTVFSVEWVVNADELVADGVVVVGVEGVEDTAGNQGVVLDTRCTVTVDTTPPTLTSGCAASLTNAAPDRARLGDNITLTASLTEPLLTAPVVHFSVDSLFLPTTVEYAAGTTQLTAWAAVTASVPEGDVVVAVSGLVDAAGNQGSDIVDAAQWQEASCGVVVDTTPPDVSVCLRSNNAVPSLARRSNRVTLTLTANEPTNVPAVHIVSTGASLAPIASVTSVGGSSSVYEASFVVEGTAQSNWVVVPDGAVGFVVEAVDLAGNAVVVNATTGPSCDVIVDQTRPSITVHTNSSNANPALARAGDLIQVAAVASEPVVPPSITIVQTQLPTAPNTTLSLTSFEVVYEVRANDTEGVAEVRLGPLLDVAGNAVGVAGVTYQGGVTIDLTPPSIVTICLSSSNPVAPRFARAGDNVTIQLTTSEQVQPVSVAVLSGAVHVTLTPQSSACVANCVASGGFVMPAGLESPVDVVVEGVVDLAGNVGSSEVDAPSGSCAVVADSVFPTVSVCLNSTNANPRYARNGDTVHIAVTTSESVTLSSIAVVPSLTAAVQGGPTEFTAVLPSVTVPTEPVSQVTVVGVSDVAGNSMDHVVVPLSTNCSLWLDSTPPTVAIAAVHCNLGSAIASLTNANPLCFALTFSEAVQTPSLGQGVVATNCPNAELSATGEESFEFQVTCSAVTQPTEWAVSVVVGEDGVWDLAGNAIVLDTSLSVTQDTKLPTVVRWNATSDFEPAEFRPRIEILDTLSFEVEFSETVCPPAVPNKPIFLIAGQSADAFEPSGCARVFVATYQLTGEESPDYITNGLASVSVQTMEDLAGNKQARWDIELSEQGYPTPEPARPTPTPVNVRVVRASLEIEGLAVEAFDPDVLRATFVDFLGDEEVEASDIAVAEPTGTDGLPTTSVDAYIVAQVATSRIADALQREVDSTGLRSRLAEAFSTVIPSVTAVIVTGDALIHPTEDGGYTTEGILFLPDDESSPGNDFPQWLIILIIVAAVLCMLCLVCGPFAFAGREWKARAAARRILHIPYGHRPSPPSDDGDGDGVEMGDLEAMPAVWVDKGEGEGEGEGEDPEQDSEGDQPPLSHIDPRIPLELPVDDNERSMASSPLPVVFAREPDDGESDQPDNASSVVASLPRHSSASTWQAWSVHPSPRPGERGEGGARGGAAEPSGRAPVQKAASMVAPQSRSGPQMPHWSTQPNLGYQRARHTPSPASSAVQGAGDGGGGVSSGPVAEALSGAVGVGLDHVVGGGGEDEGSESVRNSAAPSSAWSPSLSAFVDPQEQNSRRVPLPFPGRYSEQDEDVLGIGQGEMPQPEIPLFVGSGGQPMAALDHNHTNGADPRNGNQDSHSSHSNYNSHEIEHVGGMHEAGGFAGLGGEAFAQGEEDDGEGEGVGEDEEGVGGEYGQQMSGLPVEEGVVDEESDSSSDMGLGEAAVVHVRSRGSNVVRATNSSGDEADM